MSNIKVTSISDLTGSGPVALTGQWAARAAVQYDQFLLSVDLGYNVSSVTDNATGEWTINFINNISTSRYPVASAGSKNAADGIGRVVTVDEIDTTGMGTSSLKWASTISSGSTTVDSRANGAQVFGDLA